MRRRPTPSAAASRRQCTQRCPLDCRATPSRPERARTLAAQETDQPRALWRTRRSRADSGTAPAGRGRLRDRAARAGSRHRRAGSSHDDGHSRRAARRAGGIAYSMWCGIEAFMPDRHRRDHLAERLRCRARRSKTARKSLLASSSSPGKRQQVRRCRSLSRGRGAADATQPGRADEQRGGSHSRQLTRRRPLGAVNPSAPLGRDE